MDRTGELGLGLGLKLLVIIVKESEKIEFT